ncbi:MAG: thymidine phosphorylase [Elusimicrobia bacterium]|jgi:pyrimidine-nucleoside phosphorylase|nr:thymidine phosphorylase [Elusimicrobiota bacterium]
MNTYDLIFKKREGEKLEHEELKFLIDGFIEEKIPQYQMSAFLMAVYFKGMTPEELSDFTNIMVKSGEEIDLNDIGGITVDKHSTGGVGDGVSLSLAPLAASLGLVVPMMSGRGLGHTGGTLDKLESIPGYRIDITRNSFKDQLRKVGVAIIGQTKNIAPADKKMYSLRDVTATVDSIPLIAASIMSKKLAEGSSGLVLDVKTGSGAFMRKTEDAKKLAKAMLEIGRYNNRKMAAVISDMNQPLGRSIGNANEIKQAVEIMSGKGPDDITEITVVLAGMMLQLSGRQKDLKTAQKAALANLNNGAALKKFGDMIEAQGGDRKVCSNPDEVLKQPEYSAEVKSPENGYIEAMDTRKVGLTALSLGAGRERVIDKIDHSAGIEVFKKISDKVEAGETLAVLSSSTVKNMEEAKDMYINSLKITKDKVKSPELIYDIIN